MKIVWFVISNILLFCCLATRASSDNFDFSAELNDPVTDAFLTDTEFQTKRTIDPSTVVAILVDLIKVPCLLENNLYRYTYPLNKKSIIDVPAFFPRRDYSRKKTFAMGFFFNQTSRMFFTQNCDGIQSYIALCTPTVLQRLGDCAKCVQAAYPQFNINPLVVLPLFRNIAVQERQVGMMLHGDKQFKHVNLHVHLPILYQERNYYMTQDERACIENAFNEVLQTPCEQENRQQANPSCLQQPCADDQHHVGLRGDGDNPVDLEFVRNHLVGDAFGIGDTRIHLDWDLIKRHYYNLALGFVTTIPTAFAFKKGLFGSSFENACIPKDFSISTIMDLALSGNAQAATALGQAFGLGALNQLSHNLLDSSLGYGNHLGLGLSYKAMARLTYLIKRPWAHHIKMRSRMIIQYYLPSREIRSFVENKNPNDYLLSNFDLDRINEDPVYAQQKLDFINQKLIEELYPFKFRTTVFPGIIFQSTTNYYFEYKGLKMQLVNDFWARTKESFGTICIPPGTPPLVVKCAKRPAAYQFRIGGFISYSMPKVSSTWTISLYGDKTYWSQGIGKDFNIVFNVECNY